MKTVYKIMLLQHKIQYQTVYVLAEKADDAQLLLDRLYPENESVIVCEMPVGTAYDFEV